MGIKTVTHPPYSPDLASCDFWLFPKLKGCRYETIEEMKKAVTKVIDTLTQEDFYGAFQKLLERYNKCIAAGGNYFEGDMSFMCVLAIKEPIRKKSGNLFNDLRSYSFVCSFLVYIELRHGSLSTLVRSYVTQQLAPTADQLQCLVHEWLTARTSINTWDHIDTSWLNQSTAQPGHRSSSCLYQKEDLQLSLLSTITSWLYQQRRPPTVSTFNDDH